MVTWTAISRSSSPATRRIRGCRLSRRDGRIRIPFVAHEFCEAPISLVLFLVSWSHLFLCELSFCVRLQFQWRVLHISCRIFFSLRWFSLSLLSLLLFWGLHLVLLWSPLKLLVCLFFCPLLLFIHLSSSHSVSFSPSLFQDVLTSVAETVQERVR